LVLVVDIFQTGRNLSFFSLSIPVDRCFAQEFCALSLFSFYFFSSELGTTGSFFCFPMRSRVLAAFTCYGMETVKTGVTLTFTLPLRFEYLLRLSGFLTTPTLHPTIHFPFFFSCCRSSSSLAFLFSQSLEVSYIYRW